VAEIGRKIKKEVFLFKFSADWPITDKEEISWMRVFYGNLGLGPGAYFPIRDGDVVG